MRAHGANGGVDPEIERLMRDIHRTEDGWPATNDEAEWEAARIATDLVLRALAPLPVMHCRDENGREMALEQPCDADGYLAFENLETDDVDRWHPNDAADMPWLSPLYRLTEVQP